MALKKDDSQNLDLREFWKGVVRDPEGRWTKYCAQGIKYFKYGKQSRPNLTTKEDFNFIIAAIKQEKAFLKGLQNKSFRNYKHWLITLHKKQAYKGHGGRILPKRRISMGEHSKIVKDAVLPLAKKYSDPYTNSGLQVLRLAGIGRNGRPMDEWKNKNEVIHYYPDPDYFDDYLQIMKKKLQEFTYESTKPFSMNILILIANYFQYGVNTHLFEDINQSLFANQANAMLKYLGLKPVEQGILDFTAMRLQPKNFARYFIDEVKKANPNNHFYEK